MPLPAPIDVGDLIFRIHSDQPLSRADLVALRIDLIDRIDGAIAVLHDHGHVGSWEKRQLTQALQWLTVNLAGNSVGFLDLAARYIAKAFTPVANRANDPDIEMELLTQQNLLDHAALVRGLVVRDLKASAASR